MDKVCIVCLSNDRVLFELMGQQKLELFELLLKDELNNLVCGKYKLCWECMGYMDKMFIFQQRALLSLRTFKSFLRQYRVLKAVKLPKYSRLSMSKANCLSVTDSLNCETVEVKTENPIEEMVNVNLFEDENVLKNEISDWDQYQQEWRIADESSYKQPSSSKQKAEECKIFVASIHNKKFTRKQVRNKISFDMDVQTQTFIDSSSDTSNTVTADESFSDDDKEKEDEDKKTLTKELEMRKTQVSGSDMCQPWTWQLATEKQFRQFREEYASNKIYTQKQYKCKGCIVSFALPQGLENHNYKYHRQELGPHVCGICECRFMTKSRLDTHTTDHYSLYMCTFCDFKANVLRKVKDHYDLKHTNITYPCNECDAVYRLKKRLDSHKHFKHRKSYNCTICNEQFQSVENFKSHKATVHPEKPVSCLTCKKMCRSVNALLQHMAIHRESDVVFCKECNRTFKSEYYEVHLKTSLKHVSQENMPYECDICHKRFLTKNCILRHISVCHLKLGLFKCNQCPKAYSSRSGLKLHVAKVHDETYVRSKNILCDVCGKGFTQQKLLRDHMVTHTKERPYHCTACPSTFGYKAALYTHNKLIHEKVKRIWPKKKKKGSAQN